MTKTFFIKVSMVHCSRLVIVYSKEKFCVSAHVGKSIRRCLLSKAIWRPCRKNSICDYIRSLKRVKCSFFKQIIVYESFYGTLLMFSCFLLQGKFLWFDTCWQVTCEMFIKRLFIILTFHDKNLRQNVAW